MKKSDAPELLALRQANRGFFTPWEPQGSQDLYHREGIERDLAQREADQRNDRRYSFAICNGTGRIVGGIILANIARGAFQNATIGYYVAQEHNGKGFATEALRQMVRFAFESIGLHRVEANVMPHNPASIRVVEKAGFREEGFSPRMIQIDGDWRDHINYALTVEDWRANSGA